MPQEHYVLRCFSCETFQVHIVKKSNKWECKICGAKQSVKRNYGKGSGKDCRKQVMKLNEFRVLQGGGSRQMKDHETLEEAFVEEFKDPELGRESSLSSKWTEYLDECIPSDGSENEDKTELPGEIVTMKKRRVDKLFKNSVNSKRICRNFKRSGETTSRVCSESNPSPVTDDETLANSFMKNMCETQIQQKITEKHPSKTKSALKPGKYAKYMEDNDARQVNKSSNIFSLHLDDLDNILDF